jgi:hypothetical protein
MQVATVKLNKKEVTQLTVDSLAKKFSGSTATTTPETFADKQNKQQAEANRSSRGA